MGHFKTFKQFLLEKFEYDQFFQQVGQLAKNLGVDSESEEFKQAKKEAELELSKLDDDMKAVLDDAYSLIGRSGITDALVRWPAIQIQGQIGQAFQGRTRTYIESGKSEWLSWKIKLVKVKSNSFKLQIYIMADADLLDQGIYKDLSLAAIRLIDSMVQAFEDQGLPVDGLSSIAVGLDFKGGESERFADSRTGQLLRSIKLNKTGLSARSQHILRVRKWSNKTNAALGKSLAMTIAGIMGRSVKVNYLEMNVDPEELGSRYWPWFHQGDRYMGKGNVFIQLKFDL